MLLADVELEVGESFEGSRQTALYTSLDLQREDRKLDKWRARQQVPHPKHGQSSIRI